MASSRKSLDPATQSVILVLATVLLTERAPWISSLRRYESPRLLMPSSRFLPPVPCCLGVNPSEAARSRPW